MGGDAPPPPPPPLPLTLPPLVARLSSGRGPCCGEEGPALPMALLLTLLLYSSPEGACPMDSVTRLDATENDGDRLEMYSHRSWQRGAKTRKKKKKKKTKKRRWRQQQQQTARGGIGQG